MLPNHAIDSDTVRSLLRAPHAQIAVLTCSAR